MTVLQFLLLLLVAGVCGSLGQTLAGTSRGGLLASIALGFVGAVVGTWMAGLMGLPEVFTLDIDGRPFPAIWSILGSALFVAMLGLVRTRGREAA